MGVKYCAVILTVNLLCVLVQGQSEWIWSKNSPNNPNKGNSGFQSSGNNGNSQSGSNLVPVNTVSIFGSGSAGVYSPNSGASASGDKFFASNSNSNFPSSPQQQPAVIVQVLQPGSNSDRNSNDILPSNSIRGINGEARLLPHVRKLFHNAIHNLVGGGNSGGGGGGLGGLGNLISPNGGGSSNGIIGTLLQIGPQLAQGIGSRFPTVGSSSSNGNGGNGGTGGFNTEGLGSNSNSNNNNNGISFGGQNCNCVSSDSCRLPSIDKGRCSGGIMCCRNSGTRIAGDNTRDSTRKGTTRYQTSDVRAGLLGNIVRGTTNIFDDTLDLFLAPFLTQEDQQRLANRIASVGRRGDV